MTWLPNIPNLGREKMQASKVILIAFNSFLGESEAKYKVVKSTKKNFEYLVDLITNLRV